MGVSSVSLSFFRSGLLTDAGHLCREYKGTVQIANGKAAAGAQIPVGRAPAAVLLDLGLTVAFDALQTHIDDAVPWAEDLEAALGAPAGCVRLMGFANAPGSGLTLHHDVHDQLLIHLEGTKVLHWQPTAYVASPSSRFSHNTRPPAGFGANYQGGFPPHSADVINAGMEPIELRPGSVVFMPGGTWHTTAGQTQRTLSVAVVAEVPSLNEVLLNQLAWHLHQSLEGRKRAYGGWSGESGPLQAARAGAMRWIHPRRLRHRADHDA